MINISIKNFQKKICASLVILDNIKKIILKSLTLKNKKKHGEITVCLVDNKKIKKINFKYCHTKSATDVIAFDISENKNYLLADIVVSAETALLNAKIYRTDPLYELYLYVTHGALHLSGYDDKTVKQKEAIRQKEKRILSALKIMPCQYIKPKP